MSYIPVEHQAHYKEMQRGSMYRIFEKIDNLPLEISQLCMLGRFTRAFLEKDNVVTEELIPYLELAFNDGRFCSHAFHTYTRILEREKRHIEEEMHERLKFQGAYSFYKTQLDMILNKLKIKNFVELIEFVESEFYEYTGILAILSNSYSNMHGSNDDLYIKKCYKYYYVGQILYSEYCEQKSKLDLISHKSAKYIIDEYNKVGVDIQKEDPQFHKYKLISIKDNVQINNRKDSQTIIDSRIKKYFWISVPRQLLFTIEKLISDKLIGKISFRVDGITEMVPVLEEMEFGSSLRINVETLPDLSKFYSSEKYGNNLWVAHDKSKQSLTFEEHLDEFVLIGEEVVTQVVHLDYKIDSGQYYISHIDHEFIVYTLDEYTARIYDSNVKGYKRIKTFKADESIIPFNYKYNDEYFLLQLLDSYFKNRELVNEYFAEMGI